MNGYALLEVDGVDSKDVKTREPNFAVEITKG